LEQLRREANPPDPSDVSAQVPSSRVAQPAAKVRQRLPEGASRVKGANPRPAASSSSSRHGAPKKLRTASAEQAPTVAPRNVSSAPANTKRNEHEKVLLLQLQRPHYDAMKSGRKQWEARPLFDDANRGGRQSLCDSLATVGRVVVLQSGAGTNDRVRITEVRRYSANPQAEISAVRAMVDELGSSLLPDAANASAGVKVYESLYGAARCARGFVAMRLEMPGAGL